MGVSSVAVERIYGANTISRTDVFAFDYAIMAIAVGYEPA
jgi:hypothetical protein